MGPLVFLLIGIFIYRLLQRKIELFFVKPTFANKVVNEAVTKAIILKKFFSLYG
jgi:hypothetical protein